MFTAGDGGNVGGSDGGYGGCGAGAAVLPSVCGSISTLLTSTSLSVCRPL